jgi:8-oxo-dGTP diphosphatase
MRGYAGVIVIDEDSVLLVQEPDFFTGVPCWTFPSGGIEDGESPEVAAVRELAEEAGCTIDVAGLTLIATAGVEHDGEQLSMSWNFTAAATSRRLERAHPDETVTDARWFGRDEAVNELEKLSYDPKREPAVRFLRDGGPALQWTFNLVDRESRIPEFRWGQPTKMSLP